MNTHGELMKLAEVCGTPFYMFHAEIFAANYLAFRQAFASRYERCMIGYSFKTNYVPFLCRQARDLGAYAEVVSGLELKLALKTGYPPERIIFNGPIKETADIHFALDSGLILNLDTFSELEQVCQYAWEHPGQPVRVGLRINIALTDETGYSHIQEGRPTGRFGFSPDTLEEALRLLQRAGVVVHALHGHTSSASRSLWVYERIIRTLAEIGGALSPHSINYLNVGGGMYGRPVPAMGLTDIPRYDDYAETICTEMRRHPWIRERRPALIVEPGMALVADAFSYFTRVFEVKQLGGQRFAVVDGSALNIKPSLHRRNHPFTLIPSGTEQRGRATFSVVGSTCMEKDCLLEDIDTVAIERGDFLRIDNVGAYSIVLAPPFIHPAPPILTRTEAGFRPIRQRQSFEDFFSTFIFPEDHGGYP